MNEPNLLTRDILPIKMYLKGFIHVWRNGIIDIDGIRISYKRKGEIGPNYTLPGSRLHPDWRMTVRFVVDLELWEHGGKVGQWSCTVRVQCNQSTIFTWVNIYWTFVSKHR